MQQRFHNLDGLRFLAAVVVVISHVESIKNALGLPFFSGPFLQAGAQLAVTFFFVLSGFLIAWLLMKEKMEQPDGRINILRFYRKRILRIWPLYYLLVLLVFLLIGPLDFFQISYGRGNEFATTGYWKKMAGYLFFLPNYTGMKYGGFVYISHVWSLGVEEFFYLFFPLGLVFVKTAGLRIFLITILILSLAVSTGVQLALPDPSGAGYYLKGYAVSYRIYSFALGALAAYMYLNPQLTVMKRLTEIVKHKISINISIAVLVILLATGVRFSYFTQMVYSFLFAAFILAITLSGIRLLVINDSAVRYLGKISYGIYMFHPLAIVIAVKSSIAAGILPGSMLFTFLSYGLSVGITIGLAAVSYETYERFFLQYARRRKEAIT